MENKDSFGLAPLEYRDFRPTYPAPFFAHLAALCTRHAAALDCATGNGQAAIGLARHFGRVAAFDASAAQIAAAHAAPNVEYRVGTAESIPFADREFDLVAVAQGAHWFDLARFYAGVRRVAVPGGVIAIWGYSYCKSDPAIDAVVAERLLRRIAPYWAAGNRVIMEGYRAIEFPFAEIPWTPFVMRQEWTRAAFLNYMRTWSAYKRYVVEQGRDPMPALDSALAPLWADGVTKPVSFDLVGRLGRID